MNQNELYNNLNANYTLGQIQSYIKEVITIRGFNKQSIEQTMLLMLEEVGELAKAIRKDATVMRVDQQKLNHYKSIESEVADTFIVLLSICNDLEIDLYEALKQKEAQNVQRVWSK